ncbi:MAG: hypothetical protein LUH15_00285 [Tannerellaceae bacterium]|nr:hypothetical protein [Tannerellaceae bacterium]
MKRSCLKNSLLLLLFLLSYTGNAAIQLPALVSDGMVLQRDQPITLWGNADPGETVKITFRKKHTPPKPTRMENGTYNYRLKKQEARTQ